jgi:ankyrin repeat protein
MTDPSDDLAQTRRLNGKRVQGTCEWIRERDEFLFWEGGDGLELLWLIGAPGIGKTVMSCFLVEALQRKAQETPSTILTYYFCDNKDGLRSTATAILRGILLQLLKQRPALFELIREDYALKQANIVGSLDALWRPLLQMLNKCDNEQIYILIDALDECEVSSRRELLDMLGDMAGSSKTKVLITGRPESDIEDAAGVIGQSLRVDSAKVNDDLSKFIDIRIDELKVKKPTFPVRLIEDIRTALRDKAGGTFLWASLVLKDISSSKTSREARGKLEVLPSELSDVYKRILENIEDETEHALLVLQWVVASRRPMTVCELATVQALAARDRGDDHVPHADVIEEYKDGFKACGPLLYHDPNTDTVNLIHQSAKEYLVWKGCLPTRYHVSQEAASLSILETCWTYLSMQEFQQGTIIIGRSETNGLDVRRFTRWVRYTYGFLEYAAAELRDPYTYVSGKLSDGELADRLHLLYKFINGCESTMLRDLPNLRDFWLLACVRLGQAEAVQNLIEKGADLNVREHNRRGWSAFHFSVVAGNVKMVRLLLRYGADVMSRTESGVTALNVAVGEGNKDMVSLLLEMGANINEKDGYGDTAFSVALQYGKDDLAFFLLETGADPEIHLKDSERTALLEAAKTGCYRIVRFLVEREIGYKESSWGGDALCAAIECGHTATASFLIHQGADLEWRREHDGKSLLYVAAEVGDENLLKMLVEKGLDPNDSVNNYREDPCQSVQTALGAASAHGTSAAVEVLIEAGADISSRGYQGRTALHLAAQHGHDSAVTTLLRAGAAVNSLDDLGWTALHHAADNGHTETVTMLIQSGSDINARANSGETALHVVARSAQASRKSPSGRLRKLKDVDLPRQRQDKDLKMAQLLLKRGANVQATNLDGLTPFHLAAREGNAEITGLFVEHVIDIDATDESGMTALHQAASHTANPSGYYNERANNNVAMMLLEKGASVEKRDKAGRTPLFMAAAKKDGDMCRILLAGGADGTTMRAVHSIDETYPKVGEVRKATERWRNIIVERTVTSIEDGMSDSDNYEENKLGRQQRQDRQAERELLRLLFEMAAFALAEVDPSWERFAEACNKGYDTVVSMMAEKDVKASNSKEDKTESLMLPAGAGHEGIVRVLVERSVETEPESSNCSSALFEAASEGHENIVRFFLRTGAKVGERCRTRYGRTCGSLTPLLSAAARGHAKVVEILLDNGALISDRNDSGTALHYGAEFGHEDVVRVALERGAVIDEKEDSGSTPLHLAVHSGNKAVVRRLLVAGADTTLKNKFGKTAMREAMGSWRKKRDVLLLLLQLGANWNTTVHPDNQTLISPATTQGREVMSLLESDREWFDIHGRDGQVLLAWAVRKGYEDIVHRLLEMGVKKDVQPSEML